MHLAILGPQFPRIQGRLGVGPGVAAWSVLTMRAAACISSLGYLPAANAPTAKKHNKTWIERMLWCGADGRYARKKVSPC